MPVRKLSDEEIAKMEREEKEIIGDYANAEEALKAKLQASFDHAASLSYSHLDIDREYVAALIKGNKTNPPFLPEYLTYEDVNEREVWDEYEIGGQDLGQEREVNFGQFLPNRYPHETYQQYMTHCYELMIEHADWQETYAIGYCRIKKRKKYEHAGGDIEGYSQHTISLIEKPPYLAQHQAIRKHARDNWQKLFYTFADYQMSMSGFDASLPMLRMVIQMCEIYGATLIYCDLGNIYKHTEFNTLIRKAKDSGINVVAIEDDDAIESAALTIRTRRPKKFGSICSTNEIREKENLEKNPILIWKKNNSLATKRFNYFEYLYFGASPIYKQFLSPASRNMTDPHKWRRLLLSDEKLAKKLNSLKILTKEGYEWNKASVLKVRTKIIFLKDKTADKKTGKIPVDFRDYVRELNRLEEKRYKSVDVEALHDFDKKDGF